jgi:putative membrane protein
MLTACGSRDDTDVATAANIDDNAANEVVKASAPTAPASAEFAAAVAASDLYEIESGKLASEKAASTEVKELAKMLVADHEKSTSDLKAAASGVQPVVVIAPALDAEKQGMIDALKNASATDFDKVFIEQQKQAHQKALDLLRSYSAGGDSQPLKEFATKASTVVEGHLERLNQLQP